MAEDQQKKTSPSPPTTSTSTPSGVPQQPSTQPAEAKGGMLSRRAFLIGAVGASVLLTAASLAQSGAILGPLIPPNEDTAIVAKAMALESAYETALNTIDPVTKLSKVYTPSLYSDFFYFPYDVSVSPYYKDIIARLPDAVKPTSQSQILTVPKSQLGTQSDGRFVAYNTTCVHLRCLVNPGYDSGSGEFRLQCPCHGSQYRLSDGVPVAGPAYDLGLNPLPQITIDIDSSGNVIAKNGLNGINGTPGIGRTS